MNESESFDDYNARREAASKERQRINKLIKKYKKNMPTLTPKWDCSESSIKHCYIKLTILESGVVLAEAPLHEVFNNLDVSHVFKGSTIWKQNIHDPYRIAKIIEHWEQQTPLSPPFFIMHHNKILVPDGKHRLTVTHYYQAPSMMFYFPAKDLPKFKMQLPSLNVVKTF